MLRRVESRIFFLSYRNARLVLVIDNPTVRYTRVGEQLEFGIDVKNQREVADCAVRRKRNDCGRPAVAFISEHY